MKKKLLLVILGLLSLLLLVICLNWLSQKPASPADNFYQAVNQEWMAENQLDEDQMALSNISILQDEIDQKIEGDLATFASGEKDVPLSEMEAVVDFYRMALDLESRERDSIENLRPYLEEIEAIATFEDYQKLEKERLLQAKALPYSLSSLTLSRSKYLQLEAPVLFLGDSFYYQDQASKEQYLESFRKGAVSLMQHVGYSKEESQTLVQQAMDFDELLVPYLTGSPGILTSSGNQNTELIQLMSTLLDGKETKIVVDEAVYFSNTDKIVNEENFPLMKSWMLVTQVLQLSDLLDEDSFEYANRPYQELGGMGKMISLESAALQQTYRLFPETLSFYYGQTYFNPEDKEDVIEMTSAIRETFIERLKTLDWLTEPSRKKAIEKVEEMILHIAYPDEIDPISAYFTVQEQDNLLEAYLNLKQARISYDLGHLGQVESHVWSKPSFLVNAYYSPAENAIYLPASILQAPYYSSQQTRAENYGGIGTIIAHEMVHAFDDQGSNYDSQGQPNFWWTLGDRQTFLERMYQMEQQWSGLTYAEQAMDGKLTLGENIADAGGLSVALETYGKPDEAFFEAYARSFRSKVRKEVEGLLLENDSHAPAELRVNVPLQNLDSFYEVYDIQEGDGMYLPPEERVIVW